MQYLIALCSRLEAANDVISGGFVRLIVPDKCVKCCDPCLNRSRKIAPEAVAGSIFDSFFVMPDLRLEVVGDVISDVAGE